MRVICVVSFGAVFFGAGGVASASTCESLAALQLPHAVVRAAQSITGGSFTPPGESAPLSGLPAFCRVAVQSSPTPDSLINIEVWIPTDDAWNGKYLQVGCGGFCGTVGRQSLAAAIRRGYAGAATDDGNQAPPGAMTADGSFALAHPEKITDFGYRALKETTDTAKAVIRALRGSSPQRSYFSGCSDGGREALVEAQRFPEDFDGILAGAPANNWTRMTAGLVANEQALLNDPASYLPASKLPILSRAVLAQCRRHDSGAPGDAFLTDPQSCNFDPAATQCASGQDSNTCLTPAQVTAVKAIYGGPHNPRTGKQIVPGFVPGNEDDPFGWAIWITGASREANLSGNDKAPAFPMTNPRGGWQGFFGNSYFANFVFQNPQFDFKTFDIVAGVAAADGGAGKAIDATDPDLRPFKRHGGKIIQYHGWADPALTPINSVEYYKAVRNLLSGKPSSKATEGGYEAIQ
jgi:hypothetical protein